VQQVWRQIVQQVWEEVNENHKERL
jgi:hypothetical protein